MRGKEGWARAVGQEVVVLLEVLRLLLVLVVLMLVV
jgi:hypothetical protein